MRITRLRLTDVKRHAQLDLDLAPGLTVIRGPNESGKSTVQRAVEVGLFRRSTSTALELGSVRSWAKPDADPTVEIAFEAEGVSGTITKTFAGPKGTARLEIGSEVITDPALVDRQLAEMTGLASEKFFRSTACIRHQELADLERDEGALRDRLQQSMSGADRGTWAARRKLEDAIARYRAEGVKNPGHIKAGRDEIARLSAAADAGRVGLAGLERDRSALSVARAQREASDLRTGQAQADLDAAERAVAARDRLVKAEADYIRFKRAAELHADLARLAASHPSTMALAELRANVERMRATEYDLSERRAELASRADAAEPEPSPRRAPPWRPWLLLAAILAVSAVTVYFAIIGTTGVVAAGALAIGAAVAVLVALFMRRRASKARAANEARRTELAQRLADRTELETRLRDVERRREHDLATFQMADLSVGEALLAAETAHEAQIDAARAELRGLMGDAPGVGTDAARMRDQMAAVADETRHALAGMGDVGADPDHHRERADTEVRAARGERERALTDEAAARARVDTNTVDAEEVASVEERLEGARDQLASRERRLHIYETALGALDAAEGATMKKAARYLEQRMGNDVATITDGRYRRVQVDETELTFRVFSPEKGDWVDVNAATLSQGTLDQIYLAARLGLVRQVTQDRRPPLIFDDPFVTFDDDRATRAVALLKQMAEDFQILYLTTSDRYDSVADAVIELPAPRARDIGGVASPESSSEPPQGAPPQSGAPPESAGSPESAAPPESAGSPESPPLWPGLT